MPVGRLFIGAVVSAALLVPVATVAVRAQQGYTPPHSVGENREQALLLRAIIIRGPGPVRPKPRPDYAAIRSWASFTDFEYGPAWARWSLSVSKGVRYTKEVDRVECHGRIAAV